VGSAVIKSLLLSGERPGQDPAKWIFGILSFGDQKSRPMESVSGFEEFMLAVESSRQLGAVIPAVVRERIIPELLRCQKKDGGFGSAAPTLLETYHAVSALSGLGYDLQQLSTSIFLQHCEDETFGFLAVPGVRPGFLEHIHAGLAISAMIGYRPQFTDACEVFIRRCYRENGGYCRSLYGGSATLEHTWRALGSLAIIQWMRENRT
jgi:hypothetical protein